MRGTGCAPVPGAGWCGEGRRLCGSAAGENLFPVRTGVPGKPGSFKTPILFFLERKKRMRLLMV